MMKRLIALMLSAMVMLAAFAGCSQPAADDGDQPSQTSGEESQQPESQQPEGQQPEGEPYQLGLIIWSTTNSWARGVIDSVEYMAEGLNCELTVVEGGTGEALITAFENLCAAGVDGIIAQQGAGLGSRIIELCEEYGVYVVNTCDDWSVDPSYEEMCQSQYYVGGFYEDEYNTAYNIAQTMAENGAEKFAILSMPEGTAASFDNRAQGAKDGIAAAGGELVAEAYGFNKAENAQNIIAQYPDIDAIMCSFDAVETCVQPITSAGKTGQIMLSSCGTADGALEALQDGNNIYICDGTRADVMLSFALLYDAMTAGEPMTTDEGGRCSQIVNYIIVNTPEDFTMMTDYITEGDYPFYLDELKPLIRAFNPDATLADYAALAENYSLEDVMTRHGK